MLTFSSHQIKVDTIFDLYQSNRFQKMFVYVFKCGLVFYKSNFNGNLLLVNQKHWQEVPNKDHGIFCGFTNLKEEFFIFHHFGGKKLICIFLKKLKAVKI